MKKNMGIIDRVLRIILAVVVGILYFSHQLTGTAAWILGILAVIFLLDQQRWLLPRILTARDLDRKRRNS